MANCLLIQQGGGPHAAMLSATVGLHREYCKRHDVDFQIFGSEIPVEMDAEHAHPFWKKLALLRYFSQHKYGYEYLVWLDADCVIVGDEDLRAACPENGIGATWHSMDWGRLAPGAFDHHNAGAVYVSNVPSVRSFMDVWWNWPVGDHGWQDQYAMNMLAQEMPDVVQTIPHKWNSTPPYFEAPNPVVTAFHGLFTPEARALLIREFVENGCVLPPFWKAKIRAESMFREQVYELRVKEEIVGSV